MQRSLNRLLPDSIRRRFAWQFLAIGAVVVLVVSAIGFVTFMQTETELRETTEGRLEAGARAQAEPSTDGSNDSGLTRNC